MTTHKVAGVIFLGRMPDMEGASRLRGVQVTQSSSNFGSLEKSSVMGSISRWLLKQARPTDTGMYVRGP